MIDVLQDSMLLEVCTFTHNLWALVLESDAKRTRWEHTLNEPLLNPPEHATT